MRETKSVKAPISSTSAAARGAASQYASIRSRRAASAPPALTRDLAQRAPAGRGVLDDLRRAVVADERVERGGDGEGALGRRLAAGQVGLDPVHALLGEQLGGRA